MLPIAGCGAEQRDSAQSNRHITSLRLSFPSSNSAASAWLTTTWRPSIRQGIWRAGVRPVERWRRRQACQASGSTISGTAPSLSSPRTGPQSLRSYRLPGTWAVACYNATVTSGRKQSASCRSPCGNHKASSLRHRPCNRCPPCENSGGRRGHDTNDHPENIRPV